MKVFKLLSRWKLLKMLLFVFFRFIVLMKVTHYILFFKQKNIWAKSYSLHFVSTIFFKHMFKQKFIAWYLNESCLCALLCFLGVLRCLNKACVFFCAKYLNKIIIIIIIIITNCPDNLSYYTTGVWHNTRQNIWFWLKTSSKIGKD